MSGKFSLVEVNEEQNARMQTLSVNFQLLGSIVDHVLNTGREKALVMTKLEEAFLWAGASVASDAES